jgi:NAD+ kinase
MKQTTLNFKQIGLLYDARLPQSRVMAAEMLEFLEDMGASAWVSDSWEPEELSAKISHSNLLITLGGDGSMLRTAHLALGQEAALLGVNQGNLGFLTEIQPSEWRERFTQMLTGPYWIEARIMVRVACRQQDGQADTFDGLNEVVISRGGAAHVVRLVTSINDSYLTTYTADGMILSTPTGSTAYALAAGGPILPPELKNLLLIPVAPHLSLERAIVLSEGDRVNVKVHTRQEAVLSVDGQFNIELSDGDTVDIYTSPHVSRFLRLQEQTYFFKTLTRRLGWPQGS